MMMMMMMVIIELAIRNFMLLSMHCTHLCVCVCVTSNRIGNWYFFYISIIVMKIDRLPFILFFLDWTFIHKEKEAKKKKK